MKHLLITSNKNNTSLTLVWCQAREKTEPFIGRRESKEKSAGKKTWCQARERIEALLSRLENKEKNAGKMSWGQARERTELLFHRLKNMLLAPNAKYSIPVCEERKAREKWSGYKDGKHVAGTKRYSLRKHPFLLALRRWGRFARRNVCDSAKEISYWWRKICPESGQKRWMVDGVVTLF